MTMMDQPPFVAGQACDPVAAGQYFFKYRHENGNVNWDEIGEVEMEECWWNEIMEMGESWEKKKIQKLEPQMGLLIWWDGDVYNM